MATANLDISFDDKPDYSSETLMAMDESRKGENFVGPFDNIDDLMETLNAED